MASGGGSPCGACKFLRRKCAADCIFAPYFTSDQAPARFAAIHKVFGASNVSKLLLHVPAADRYDAVLTIAYEAQARIRDPVYGCVAHIFALQQQVAYLQAQLVQVKTQLAQTLTTDHQSQWASSNFRMGMGMTSAPPLNTSLTNHMSNYYFNSLSSQCSLDSLNALQGMQETASFQSSNALHVKKRPSHSDMNDLEQLALRMMKHE